MLRIVVDTNVWIRTLLGGHVTLLVLTALQNRKFKVIFSEAMLDELSDVWQRPRLRKRIDPFDVRELFNIIPFLVQ
jgi:uncharacterized protein